MNGRTVKGCSFGRAEKTVASPIKVVRSKVKSGKLSEEAAKMRTNGVKFESQVGRDKIKVAGAFPDVHESRFSYACRPCKVLGTYQKSSTPDFSKTMARDSQGIFCPNMVLNDYSPPQPSYLSSLHTGRNFLCVE